MTTNSVQNFVDDTVGYFNTSYTQMHSVPRDTLAELQLAGIQLRFEQLRDRVGVLKRLADKQKIGEINDLEDVIPLLFEHSMYKSYPSALLINNRFDQVTNWLSKLTTHDLSAIDVSNCNGIDEWIDRMDRFSPLTVCHSSGTSGSFSFLPWSKHEFHAMNAYHLLMFQQFGDPRPTEIAPKTHVIYPSYRSGGGIHARGADGFLEGIAHGDESYLHCAFPERMNSDVMYLAGRLRAAKAKGELDRPEIPPALMSRLREFEGKRAAMSETLDRFLTDTTERLAGKRVWMAGAFPYIYPIAERGLAKGRRNVFASDSVVTIGGGAKGLVLPDRWEEKLAEFAGVRRINVVYAMSEALQPHRRCEHGHYHMVPSIIPFILDPDTSKPLPRTGTVTGRMAFYDLHANSRWGGFITGDEVTMHWDDMCPCGQTSRYIDGKIERFSEKQGGDDKITCAGTAEAHSDAMEFLGRQAS